MAEFILTAYTTRDHEEPQSRRGRCYSSYVARCFYATQAMLYPACEVEAIRSLLWKDGVERWVAPYDLLIQRRAMERQHLYTTRHSLVQHIGMKSTGLGKGHTSPSFGRSWPEPS